MKRILAGLLGLMLLGAPVMADDLSNGSWSTTDNSNNATPPNGWPAGMNPSQVEPTARSNMGGTKRWWERANPNLSTTGSGGAYVLTPSNTSYPTAYSQGEVYCAKANFSAIGADTLNVNGLGAKPLYIPSASGLVADPANTLIAGQQFCASYDGALNSGGGGFQILSLPAASQNASGTWTPVDASGAALSLTSPVGYYRTSPGFVTIWGSFVYPVTSDGSSAKIGGLPFTAANLTIKNSVLLGIVQIGGGSPLQAPRSLEVLANSTTMQFTGQGRVVGLNSDLSGNAIYFTATYPD